MSASRYAFLTLLSLGALRCGSEETCRVESSTTPATIVCPDGSSTVIPSGAAGRDGEDGMSCQIETSSGATVLVCEDGTSVALPTGADSSCILSPRAEGGFDLTCPDGSCYFIPGDGAATRSPGLSIVGGVASVGASDGVGTDARMDGALDGAMSADGMFLYFVDSFNGTVRRFGIRSRRVVTLAGRPGVEGSSDGIGDAASFENPRGIAVDEQRGLLYVNDGFSCTIRTLELATNRVRTLAGNAGECGHVDGSYGEARFGLIIGTTMSPDGRYLYLSDRSSQTLRRLDLMTERVETVAGSPGERSHADGQGGQARFSGPGGIAFGPSGNYLYVNDTFNTCVRRVDVRDFSVVTVAGMPGESGGADGVGSEARFSVSQGLTVAGSTAYVAGFHGTVRALELGTETSTAVAVRTIAGASGQSGSTDGDFADARFGVAFGIVAHPDGQRLYYFDRGNDNIRRLDLAKQTVDTVMGPSAPSGWADGALGVSRFSTPQGITVSPDGATYYVADRGNDVVRGIDAATREVTTLWGRPGESGRADGRFDGATFDSPYDLVVTADGSTMYVSESGALRAIDLWTSTSTTLTTRPTADAEAPVDGPLTLATFDAPRGLALSADGSRLYVADGGFAVLREVDLMAATVRTLQPTLTGTSTPLSLSSPSGVALSSDAQQLYFTDTSRHVVWQMELSTRTATIVAGRLDERGSFDGRGAQAAFAYPDDLALDAAGAGLYVTDSSSHAVRYIRLADREVSTVVGQPGVSGGIGVGPTVPLSEARLYYPAGVAATADGLVLTADEAVFEAILPASP